jgi:adenylate cyclase
MHLGFRRQLLLLDGVGAAVVAMGAYETDALRRLELSTIDTRFDVRGVERRPEVAVVGIDSKTIDEIKRYRATDLPRAFHARVIDALRRDGARLVAMDLVFNRSTTLGDDNALIEATGRARPVVFAASAVDERGETDIFGGVSIQRRFGARVGSANFNPDPGGIFRRVRFEVEGLETFAVVAAEAAGHRTLRPGDIGGDTALIDYAGPPGSIREVPYVDVLRGRSVPMPARRSTRS